MDSSVTCQILYFHPKKNGSPVDSILAPSISPIACACSMSHFIVIDRDRSCYGFGVNKNNQIDKTLPKIVSSFSRIQLSPKEHVREIAASEKFSAFLLENGYIVVHGQFYQSSHDVSVLKNYIAPRGISARNGILSFAENKENIIIISEKVERKFQIHGSSIIKTAISTEFVYAQSSNGNIFKMKIENEQFEIIKIEFPILTMYVSSNTLIVSDFNYQLFNIEDDQISPIVSALFSQTVNAEKSGAYLVTLDSEGFLHLTTPKGRSLSYTPFRIPQFKVSCFWSNKEYVVVFKGDPVLPIRSAAEVFHNCSNQQFLIKVNQVEYNLLAFDADNSYFLHPGQLTENDGSTDEINQKVYNTSQFATDCFTSPTAHVSLYLDRKRLLYYTSNSRVIFPDIDDKKLFNLNLLVGDIVTTSTGITATFVGIEDGRIWLQTSNARCVYSIDNPFELIVIKRSNHIIRNAFVDGNFTVVDRTPEFCAQFGYQWGDLIWCHGHGIVQFIGVAMNRLVLLDFSDFSLFSVENLSYEIIRTDNPSIKRRVTTIYGDSIELNISSKGHIFIPGDRVTSTELGDSTVLGTDENGSIYLQNDKMKSDGLMAVQVDSIQSLRLLRRIGIPTTRQITLNNGSSITLSISTNDRGQSPFMSGDFVCADGQRFKVIGVDIDSHKAYGETLDSEKLISELSNNATLIYRSDILGGESSEFVEVGSPALEISNLLPDDIVKMNNNKVYRFVGLGRSGLYFVDPNTEEAFSTSFAPLIMTEGFEVIQSTVYPVENRE